MQLKGLVFVSLLPSPTSVYRAPWFSASPEFSGRRYSFLGISSAVEVHCGPWHGISQSSLIDLRSFHCLFPPKFLLPFGFSSSSTFSAVCRRYRQGQSPPAALPFIRKSTVTTELMDMVIN
ncbi:hypothetical protein SLA2020_436000 [Shorea laevis]